MAGSEITMTAEALDRLGKVTRLRERARIAEKVDVLAASYEASDATAAMFAFAEELRTEGVAVKQPTVEQVAQANAREAEIVDAIVAEQEQGDGLPEVHHMDDFEEGTAIVSNLAARRALNVGAGAAGTMRD